MKYMATKSLVQVVGHTWLRDTLAAQEIELTAHDVDNARDANGKVTRDSLEVWLDSHAGDFQSIDDFWASIEVGEDTVDIPWENEENEGVYNSLAFPELDEDEGEGDGHRNLAVRIWPDLDAENPANEGDWRPFSFSRRHASFRHPDSLPGLTAELADGRAFWLSYFEHGDCMWMLQGAPKPPGTEADWRFDGVDRAGVLIWDGDPADLPESLEDRKAWAAAFIEAYTLWCNGQGYGYEVTDADSGTTVGECGGYLGMDTVLAAVFESGLVKDDDVITEATFTGDGTSILGEVEQARAAHTAGPASVQG